MIYTTLTKKALKLCFEAHKNQVDKSGMPYVFHPFHLAEQMDTEDTAVAALLHDVVEDAGVSIEEVGEKFGARVRELVGSETENKREELPPSETWRIRKEETLLTLEKTDDIGVVMLWLGDKLANMRSIYRSWKIEGDAMWQRFNQKDSGQQAWYYRTIVAWPQSLSDTSAWLEYKTLTELVFGKGE